MAFHVSEASAVMAHNNVATLPQFSGLQRVVGPWLPDLARAGPEAPAWFLIGRSASHQAAWVVAIRVSPFRIGRDPAMDLAIPCPTVSRVHAEVLVSGGRLQVRDLSSTNGTFVDGRRIWDCASVPSNSLLQLADVPFRVLLVSETDTDNEGAAWGQAEPRTGFPCPPGPAAARRMSLGG